MQDVSRHVRRDLVQVESRCGNSEVDRVELEERMRAKWVRRFADHGPRAYASSVRLQRREDCAKRFVAVLHPRMASRQKDRRLFSLGNDRSFKAVAECAATKASQDRQRDSD